MSTVEQSRQPADRLHGDPKKIEMPLRRLLVYVVAVSLSVFLLHEALDRWLIGVDDHLHQLIHLVGHVLSSLALAALVGWLIVKNARVFPSMSSAETEWPSSMKLSEAERRKMFAEWFVAMRWIAVLLSGLLVFFSVHVVQWLPSEVWWPLTFTVATLAGTNFLYAWLLRRDWRVPVVLQAQAYVDLVILVVLLHYSGGIENPLSLMMLFHVIIGGLVLLRRQAYAITLAAIGLFALLAWAEWADVVEHHTLQLFPHEQVGEEAFHPAHHSVYVVSLVVVRGLVFLLVAYFVTTLTEKMRGARQQIEKMNDWALAERQLLERSLETTGVALRVLTQELQPYWTNRRWNEWFSCRPGELCHEVVRLTSMDSPAARCFKDARVHETEIVRCCSDCSSRSEEATRGKQVFRVITAPLLDEKRQVKQVVELFRDVTQEKQVQEQMMRAGKLAAVGELAGQVAHEVNNPIGIISAKARLLLSDHREGMTPKVAQELGKITDSADRVARIAQGLLSYCRPSTGTRFPVDARAPIHKSLAMIEQRARSAGVRIEEDLSSPIPLVLANAGELEQVFLNLFLNALDAMPGGGVLQVSARAGQVVGNGKPAVVLSVQDTGSGIPRAIQNQIFEPFFTTKQEGHGTGLGLSICSGLVRSHGGEIEVESEPGRGARFIVTLPTKSADVVGKEQNG